MSAYADKIAREVLEADLRAGSKGVCHPPLDWHKAVALARAVSCKPAVAPEVRAQDPWGMDKVADYNAQQAEVFRGVVQRIREALKDHGGHACSLEGLVKLVARLVELDDARLMNMVRIYHGWQTDGEMVETVGYSLELYVERMRRAWRESRSPMNSNPERKL